MTELEFKKLYITQFLASYMASRYDYDCMNGHPNEPYNHQPITDAAFNADCAWEQIKKSVNVDLSIDKNLFTF